MLGSSLHRVGQKSHLPIANKNEDTLAKLPGKKIGILIESDFYEHEIGYYHYRFAEKGADVYLLTRLWGQPSLTFTGHEYHAHLNCNQSFENILMG